MAEKKNSSPPSSFPYDPTRTARVPSSMPPILQTGTRAGGALPTHSCNVVVEQSYPLAALGRGETPTLEKIEDGRKLLALEAEDGTPYSSAPTGCRKRSKGCALRRSEPQASISRASATAKPRLAAGWIGCGRSSRCYPSTGTPSSTPRTIKR